MVNIVYDMLKKINELILSRAGAVCGHSLGAGPAGAAYYLGHAYPFFSTIGYTLNDLGSTVECTFTVSALRKLFPRILLEFSL